MDPIICARDGKIVLNAIKEYLKNKDKCIEDLVIVETKENQVVFLVNDKTIDSEAAKIWWSGYSEGMRIALNSHE